MNLEELIGRIESKVRHQPKVAAYRGQLAEDVNEAHRQLLTDWEWPFMRRTAPFWQFPDGVFTATLGANPTTAVAFGTAVTTTPAWQVLNDALVDDDLAQLTGEMLDGEFELSARTTQTITGAQNWEDGPFAVESLSPTVSGGAAWICHLDPRFTPDATAATTSVQARLVFRRRQLPVNCLWPKWVTAPDGRVIPVVSSAEAQDYYTTGNTVPGLDIREQTAQDVRVFVLDDGPQLRFPTPGRLGPAGLWGDEEGYTTVARRDWDRMHPPGIHNPISVTSQNTGSGTLTAGTTYRVFASWYVSGRYGPRSKIATVTISAGHNSILVENLPAYQSGAHANGRRVSIWLSDAQTERAFYLAGHVIDEQDSDVDIDHDPANRTTLGNPADSGAVLYADLLERWDDVYTPKYQALRPWPRPESIERHELTYIVRPRELLEPTDEPEASWAAFHDVLVYKVVHELCTTFGARTAARTYQAQLNHRMRRLKARFKPKARSRATGIGGSVLHNPWPTSGVNWQG